MKEHIIKTLPIQFTAQQEFLRKQGNNFISEMFDECGCLDGIVSAQQIAELMPKTYGNITTRTFKVRAAIVYLIAEGKETNEPQIFRFAGKYSFKSEQ